MTRLAVRGAEMAAPGADAVPAEVVADTLSRTGRWVDSHALLPAGSSGVVGLSGGPDSLCLLHLLCTIAADRDLSVHAVCVDHGLRAESAKETARAMALAASLGVAAQARSLGSRLRGKGNVQERARTLRLDLFREEARRLGARWIALGHTADDQAETVVMRMIRGAGTRGMAGMAARSGPIVRPLLWATRQRVEAYLRGVGLEAVHDPSNQGDAYLRNRVRQGVLPQLRRENPQIVASLARLAQICREDDEALEAVAEQAWSAGGGDAGLELNALRGLPPGLLHRVLALAYARVSGARRGLTRDHLVRVSRLVGVGGGTRGIDLPGVRVERVYDRLTFAAPTSEGSTLEPMEVEGPGVWRWAEGPTIEISAVSAAQGLVDELRLDAVQWPITLRGPFQGDRIQIAEGRSKKVFRALLDAKVPRGQRLRHPVVVQNGRVVLILGVRRACRLGPERGMPAVRFSVRK